MRQFYDEQRVFRIVGESGESRFSVLRGQESILLSGDGIDEVRVTPDSLTVTGSGMNYRLKVARSGPERRALALSGSAAGELSLHFADSSCTVLRLPMP